MRLSNFYNLLLIVSIAFLFFPKQTEAATLSLSPSSQTVAVNATMDINVVLNTEGAQTSATDVIVTYDSSKLNLIDIIPGSLYNQYIGEDINNSAGRASISGIANSTSTLYSGTGTFATFRFRGIQSGSTSISFEHSPGNLNDTNVNEINVFTDALDSVQNGTYTVSGGTSSTTVTPTSASTTTTTTGSNTSSSTTSSTGGMPVSGNSFPAIVIAIIGSFFLWIGSLLGKES
ncbi:hypothetical protein HY469_03205 [Candidatus Roizmanbacteria bacterium]|nr:hypothetical protein [Candidatus Roizmanbacteria bacterium]